MPVNNFLPFAVGSGANVVTQTAYAALAALQSGYQTGIAQSAQLNKTWRQSSIISSVIAQLINAQTGADVIDDGTTATILANLTSAIKAVAGIVAASEIGVVTTGGATTLSATQYANHFLVFSGALTSNATISFPASWGQWTVVNNCTGAFNLTVKILSSSGSTLVIPQGGRAQQVYSDTVNMQFASNDSVTMPFGDSSTADATTLFVQQAVSQVGGFYQDTGVVNAYVITTIPATTAYSSGMSFRVRIVNANTITTPTLNAGPGGKVIYRDDGTAVHAGDIPVNSIVTVTYLSTLNSGAGGWLLNTAVSSQFGAVAKENFGNGVMDDGAGNLTLTIADQSLRLTALGLQASRFSSSFSGAVSIVASGNNTTFVASGVGTLTVPLTSGLWNGFSFGVLALSGQVTVTPNASDRINGGALGASYLVAAGGAAYFATNGAGNINVISFSQPPGLSPSPQYINSSTVLTSGQFNIDTSAGSITLTMPFGAVLGTSVRLFDFAGTWDSNSVTLLPNGNTIVGDSSNMILDVANEKPLFTLKSGDWTLND